MVKFRLFIAAAMLTLGLASANAGGTTFYHYYAGLEAHAVGEGKIYSSIGATAIMEYDVVYNDMFVKDTTLVLDVTLTTDKDTSDLIIDTMVEFDTLQYCLKGYSETLDGEIFPLEVNKGKFKWAESKYREVAEGKLDSTYMYVEERFPGVQSQDSMPSYTRYYIFKVRPEIVEAALQEFNDFLALCLDGATPTMMQLIKLATMRNKIEKADNSIEELMAALEEGKEKLREMFPTTGINSLSTEKVFSGKYIENGKVLINRNGKVFGTNGARVK